MSSENAPDNKNTSVVPPSDSAKNKAAKKLTGRMRFSKKVLSIYVIVFVLIGGYLLWHSFAAQPIVASIEGEHLNLPAGASVVNVANASGGQAAELTQTGSASGTVEFSNNSTSLTIVAKGSKCSGSYPKFSLAVDGTVLLTKTISKNGWRDYSVTQNLASGNHSISMSLLNGYSNSSCSRNLFVDVINFFGPIAVTPTTTVTLSASPTTVMAGSASTLTWSSTNATSCTASGSWSGSQATQGSVSTGALNSASTYSLSCTGTSGTASATATVGVTPVSTAPPPSSSGRTYPLHTNIVSTTFWVGEIFNGSIADGSQVCSTYDSQWAYHWSGINNGSTDPSTDCKGAPLGGCDGVPSGSGSSFQCETQARTAANNYFPTSVPTPKENPFYLDLPFDDINDSIAFNERCTVIPWANDPGYAGNCTNTNFSYMKNFWVSITGPNGSTCYGQIEDAGPSSGSAYHDANYVFSTTDARPLNKLYSGDPTQGDGMDVSPALNGCLGFKDLDGDDDHVSWQFVDAANVPTGPWKNIVTTSGVTE